ncbi:CHASE2 domain-containing protein [Candidatus Calescamantes bacterium]|nr:CHASE2 domain-containing protein [Candidatus Calescamantes bacterium]
MRKFHTHYLFTGVVSGAISVLIILLLFFKTGLNYFSNNYLDLLFNLKPEEKTKEIVIIEIDEESLKLLGEKWPLPRKHYGELLHILKEAGVKAVGFDILFIDKSDEKNDKLFASSLSLLPVVLAGKLEKEVKKEGNLVLEKTKFVLPYTPFLEQADWGLVNLPIDNDGKIRRVQFYKEFNNQLLPIFALVLSQKSGVKISPEKESPLINFSGRRGTFPSISLVHVLGKKIELSSLKDKIILVGATLPELHDFFPIPFKGEYLPGVEVQANILHNLLQGNFLKESPWKLSFILLILFSIIGCILALFVSTPLALFSLLILSLVLFFPSLFLFLEKNYFWDISLPLLPCYFTFTLTSLSLKMRIVTSPWIGKYRVVEELGRGGMAIVYRACRRGRKGFVALKVLQKNLAEDPAFVKRFHREAEAMKTLHHPNIVCILDVGKDEDNHFLVMEFLKGKGLDDYLREKGMLSEEESLNIALQIAQGLKHAHDKGIIHRDLKPGNIILTPQGAKIVDFGLAKDLSSEATKLTTTGTIMGTPEYMAPEQFRGEEADPRADIYALGVVLYEMLTGIPPFTGESIGEIMNKHLWEQPDFSGINKKIAKVLSKMLAKGKEERYKSMEEVIEELERVKGGDR